MVRGGGHCTSDTPSKSPFSDLLCSSLCLIGLLRMCSEPSSESGLLGAVGPQVLAVMTLITQGQWHYPASVTAGETKAQRGWILAHRYTASSNRVSHPMGQLPGRTEPGIPHSPTLWEQPYPLSAAGRYRAKTLAWPCSLARGVPHRTQRHVLMPPRCLKTPGGTATQGFQPLLPQT